MRFFCENEELTGQKNCKKMLKSFGDEIFCYIFAFAIGGNFRLQR